MLAQTVRLILKGKETKFDRMWPISNSLFFLKMLKYLLNSKSSMARLEIHVTDKSELNDVLSIRRKVFTEEQGINPNADKDGLDEAADHIIAIYDGLPVGCTRIRFLNGKAKLERLAVLREYRSKGIATEIIKSTVEYCNSKKVNEIYFDAQYYLKGFYERFGFKVRGEPFEEVGIEHIEMYMEF